MITYIALIIFFAYLAFLLYEKKEALRNRRAIKYVIHVNGIRGKSSTTRLIHAGLLAGGYSAVCKTTGTLPMIVDQSGRQILIKRRGRANVKEQLWVLKKARQMSAQVLVVECMAIDKALQRLCEEDILLADIGVITNVRQDHTDEMGHTLEQICDSLCNMIPKNRIVITADKQYCDRIEKNAAKLGARLIQAQEKEEYSKVHFADNVAIAVQVCRQLGVDEKTALEAMKSFVKDPYDLYVIQLKSGAYFMNGLSINDPISCQIALGKIIKEKGLARKKLILLINNRPDRGYRAQHMILLAKNLKPDEVWLMGAFRENLRRNLIGFSPKIFLDATKLPFDDYDEGNIIFAVGNIGNHGDEILQCAKKGYVKYV